MNRLFAILVSLTLFFAPTQFGFKLCGVYITPADLLLLLSVGASALLVCRGKMRLPAPSAMTVLFLACVCISAGFAADKGEAVKELAQMVLYFFAAERVAALAFKVGGDRWIRRGVIISVAALALNLILAAIQYFGDGDVLAVRGAFSNRNIFSGYVATLLPLCFYLSPWAALAAGIAAAFLILSGAAWAIAALVMLIIAARTSRRSFALGAAGFLICAMLLPFTPRANDAELFNSAALYDMSSGEPTRRYPEWQVAWTLALERPFVGVGPGAYQANIGPYYGTLPNPTGPSEPAIQNMHLVIASSMGFPAAFCFASMLLAPLVCGKSPRLAPFSFAALAFALCCIWYPLLVRGLGIPLVFILSAAKYECEKS